MHTDRKMRITAFHRGLTNQTRLIFFQCSGCAPSKSSLDRPQISFYVFSFVNLIPLDPGKKWRKYFPGRIRSFLLAVVQVLGLETRPLPVLAHKLRSAGPGLSGVMSLRQKKSLPRAVSELFFSSKVRRRKTASLKNVTSRWNDCLSITIEIWPSANGKSR